VVEEMVDPFETLACSPMTVNFPQGIILIIVNGMYNSIIFWLTTVCEVSCFLWQSVVL
jgi:hypothetical protein